MTYQRHHNFLSKWIDRRIGDLEIGILKIELDIGLKNQ